MFSSHSLNRVTPHLHFPGENSRIDLLGSTFQQGQRGPRGSREGFSLETFRVGQRTGLLISPGLPASTRSNQFHQTLLVLLLPPSGQNQPV